MRIQRHFVVSAVALALLTFSSPVAAQVPELAPMPHGGANVSTAQQWEYKTVSVTLPLSVFGDLINGTRYLEDGVAVNLHSGWLDQRGAQGWELVAIVTATDQSARTWNYFFKRPRGASDR